jgi:hypothetical protein
MIRKFCWTLLAVLVATSPVAAKDWAQKMFAVKSHDFGHVARGAKTEFAFELQNPYEEDVHIAAVRTSCGCPTPTITKEWLKTWEKGGINAVFNTRSFQGDRKATITVVIDKPYYAEVQLNVSGYIHADVDFQPGSINFGEVSEGQPTEQRVTVTHNGSPAWQITDVQSANENLEVELSDPLRRGSQVSYTMLVRLKDSASAGYIQDSLMLVTNDRNMPQVPIAVEGRIVPPLTVSPSPLFVGVLAPGQTVTKQLVVRAKTPFRITNVSCEDGSFQFKVADQPRSVHLVPVVFTASTSPGEIERMIEIQTDLPSGGMVTCIARGTIKENAGQISLKPVTK